jgi:predicted peroxiredoxin
MGGTFLFKKEIFQKVKFRHLDFMEDNCFLRDCIRSGIKIVASDKYNYVYMRHSNLKDHTFRMPSDIFLETYNTQKIVTAKDFSSLVTV